MLKKIFSRDRQKGMSEEWQTNDNVPAGLMTKCERCNEIYYRKEMEKNLFVCPNCDYHHHMRAWKRINSLFDEGSFEEWDANLETTNPLNFPDYLEKVKKDQEKTKLKEAVVTGKGTIEGYETAFAVMDSRFRMGSMGIGRRRKNCAGD